MKVKAIIFDLDGTLLNTLEDLAASTNYALKTNGFAERSIDEVRSFVGNGLGLLAHRALPQGKENPLYEKVLADLRSHYAEHSLVKTKPYDGIIKMLDFLKAKNITTAIVSNKPDAQVKSLAEIFFSKYMDNECCIGECAGVKRKPAPDTVLKVMKHLNLKKEECIYVGDSEVDIETAKNAGLKCISVSWGFKGREFLIEHKADTIIDKPEELLQLLEF
ncbi:HAD family hydrolase [Treponema sp.]|uniref:HAD family hydrolase n=1 Tax=Treponema sp. TaxID=166 RepID=UPI0025FF2882|nr:HAD-IIIA family hydrolase [Treponema sp.]MCR5217103.1 HAD-IIIA family hydrolase [Treponema sp.]